MGVATMLKQSISVYRQQATSGSKKQSTLVSTEKIMIAPMSATAASIAGMAFARSYTGYALPTANILIGDYLQDRSGNKYDVQGARNYTMGSQPFIELTLQRQTQQGQI